MQPQSRAVPRPPYSKEVTPGILVVSAVEVLGHLHTILGNIGGTVANRDGPELALLDVLAHVPGHSLDVGSGTGGVDIVDDLVGREEGQGVVVLGEDIDGSKDVLQVFLVVGSSRVGTVDGDGGGVDILSRNQPELLAAGGSRKTYQQQIDASIIELLHALVVIGRVVDSV